ncbi:hypothetical protein CEUSTIGMA_g12099.t1 [Chlamydomonas eustigma]|uniref:AP2/ERF domain-containing protein n=1 Tax=Chlamydomonas eustigma TaxID=1157962 RepID=A0A250XNN0_9CHLO|nr:hypothetical protein CEUSTIGMA_g12099.t1 [Chlamydomonas eustigma]|eukprot:GAX84678.1 hypothetical protein CEUSTIGMA_g12099.t1 [Chlamydomonas eustigma]
MSAGGENFTAANASVANVMNNVSSGLPDLSLKADVDVDMQGGFMVSADADGEKPLTSQFRGVCWNKKNRRWQAAINSSGKYIYLGSFVSEEEAAHMFDRAAIRLRGHRAKLNFNIQEYMDSSGNLQEDSRIAAIIGKTDVGGTPGNPSSKGGATNGGAGGGTATAGRTVGGGGTIGHDQLMASVLGPDTSPAAAMAAAMASLTGGAGNNGAGGGNVRSSVNVVTGGYTRGEVLNPGGSGHNSSSLGTLLGVGGGQVLTGLGGVRVLTGGARGASSGFLSSSGGANGANYTVSANIFKGKAVNPLEVPLPPGCTLEATIPGEEDAFGILYQNAQRALGAVIWDGFASQDIGVFDTDRDARTACNSALRIVLQYKSQNALLLQSLAESMLPSTAANHLPPPQSQLHVQPNPSSTSALIQQYGAPNNGSTLQAADGAGSAAFDGMSLSALFSQPLPSFTTTTGSLINTNVHLGSGGGSGSSGSGGVPLTTSGGVGGTPPVRSFNDLFTFLASYQRQTLPASSGVPNPDLPSASISLDASQVLSMLGSTAVCSSMADAPSGMTGSGASLPILLSTLPATNGAPNAGVGSGEQGRLKRPASDDEEGSVKRAMHHNTETVKGCEEESVAQISGGKGVDDFSALKSMANVTVADLMKQLTEQAQAPGVVNRS